MIKVSPNRFFLKNVPPSGSIIPLAEEFPDLSLQASSETLDFSTGDRNVTHVVSGNTFNPLTAGRYNLVGGYLKSYVSGADITNTGTPLDLSLYAFREDFQVSEGGLNTLSNTLNSPTEGIYTTTYDEGGNLYAEETFDGTSANLDFTMSAMSGYIGRQPFLWAVDAYIIYSQGHIRTKKMAKKALQPYITHYAGDVANLNQGMGVVRANTRHGASFGRIFLRKRNLGTMEKHGSRWIPMIRRPNGTTGVEPDVKFKWNEIEKYVQYDNFVELPMGDDSMERQTTNNTIFDEVTTSRLVHNPWNADLTNPLVYSTMDLTKVEGAGMGNAAHIYHSWDHASGNIDIQKEFGRSNDVNGQVARMGIWNVPVPLITDVGNDVDGDRRTYFPEISLDMRVDKLSPVPLYGMEDWTNRYTKTDIMNDGGGDVNSGIIYAKATGATQQTRADACVVKGSDYLDNRCESLLRGVAIIFSNYRPLPQHTTLDEFVNYGLNNYYINARTRGGIVGGLIFKTYGSAYDDDGDVGTLPDANVYPHFDKSKLYVQALPVMCNHDLSGTVDTEIPEGKLYQEGGIMRLSTAYYSPNVEDGGVLTGDEDQSPNYLLRLGMGSWIPAYEDGEDWAQPPLWQALDMNSFFKVRFFWDILAENGPANFSRKPYQALTSGVNYDTGTASQALGVITGTGTTFTPAMIGYNLVFADATDAGTITSYTSATQVSVDTSQTVLTQGYSIDVASKIANRGPVLRAIFETSEGPSAPSGSAEDLYKFIDIPFPMSPDAGEGAVGGSPRSYSFTDAEAGTTGSALGRSNKALLWPQYMTIWVNNFRWIQGSSNTLREEEKYLPADQHFYNGDLSPTGGTMEAEVYLDNITFKNFTPSINNHTPTNNKISPWIIKPSSTESPLFIISGSGSGPGDRNMVTFNSTNDADAPTENTGGYQTLRPSQALIFGWDDPADMPTSDTNTASGYCLFNDFSTLNYPKLNRFVYSQYSSFPSGGTLSMASNVVTNQLNNFGMQLIGSHYVSGSNQAYWLPTGSNLSGSSFAVTQTSTISDNKLTIASGSNSFLSVDAFTQKGFAYLSVSGAAGDNTTVDYGNWGKREHAAVSVKIMDWATNSNDLEQNQLVVADNSIFNEFQNDEYIIYRAYGPTASGTGLSVTGLRLADDGAIDDNIITFNKSVLYATSGNRLLQERWKSELYISPRKHWVTMVYAGGEDYSGGNDEMVTKRTYGSMTFVSGTPNDASLSTYTGSTFNESLYSYNTSAEATVGLSALSDRMWEINLSEEDTDLELKQDWGYGAWDEEVGEGGQIDTKTTISGAYVDWNLKGPVNTKHIGEDETFLLYWRMGSRTDNQGVTLFSPAYSDSNSVPRFYWEYEDKIPMVPDLKVEPAVDLLNEKTDLYELTTENLNAVKFTWPEKEEDIWYRYMIFNSGNVANKYEGARIWMPLNEEPPDQRLSSLDTPYTIYDVVSGTSTSIGNGFTGVGNIAVLYETGAADAARTPGTYAITDADYTTDGSGEGATMTVVVAGGGAATITLLLGGTGFVVDEIITIDDDSLGGGGAADLTVEVASLKTGNVYSDLNGIAGWAPQFTAGSTGKYLFLASGGNFDFPFQNAAETEKFSIMIHCTPVSGMVVQRATILSKGWNTGSGTPLTAGLRVSITGANANVPRVEVKHATTSLLSTSILPVDGSAANIIYTYNSGSSTGPDAKLYVNGVLEDYADTAVALPTRDYDLYIGTDYDDATSLPSTTDCFDGSIEEIVFYNHELHVPQNGGEYLYSTAGDEDLASDSLITHNAKLFLCDYHNIRGKSLREQCSSNLVSWRATTL